jgi:alpha-galactosidase
MSPTTMPLLRGGGTSLLLHTPEGGPATVVHWGADLGPLDTTQREQAVRATRPAVPHSALDTNDHVPLLPQTAHGWSGRPCLSGRASPWERPGRSPEPRLVTTAVSHDAAAGCVVTSTDPHLGVEVDTRLAVDAQGVLTMAHRLTNTGTGCFGLAALLTALPLPAAATEVLDLTGRWCRERAPQRRPLQVGAWVREMRHGRTGHDGPLLLVAGTPAFGFRHGEVWSVHLGWSGDQAWWAERLPTSAGLLGAGELLQPAEVELGPGQVYESPVLTAAWSDAGLDGLSDRLHATVRTRDSHPRRARPVVLNTWEAVYFDHDLATLRGLADSAADLGVERFVLDDGWFRGRTDDHRALGDWTVDPVKWPDGLHPLVDHVRELGMEFGLWVEPEMVNLDSDLARAHPDWVLGSHRDSPLGPAPSWRHQQVLDLSNPAAYDHVRTALEALLDEYDIAFLKWDMNRDLFDTGGAVHEQTRAVYRLLDELTAGHPGLEVESCSSGGARVDLGVLARTHRVWASDCNDALERQHIQRWTGLLLPPELVGSHVGPPDAHTTGRRHRLGFRAATALFGHFGIEWDVSGLDAAEADELREWIALYKRERGLLHTGRVVRGDHPDDSLLVQGVVAADQDQALFCVASVASSPVAVPLPVRLPGLDPARQYRVARTGPAPHDPGPGLRTGPHWLDDGPVTLPGSVLRATGLSLPTLAPESAVLLRATAV